MTEKDRIEELQRALESGESSSEETASLIAVVRMLEDMPEPQIDPSFAAALESRLVGTTAAGSPGSLGAGSLAAITRIEERRARRIRRGLVAAIAAAMMLALPVAASAAAVPGSLGYGARLAREEARLWATCRAGAVRCGFGHLDRADARVADLRGVLRRGDVRQVPATSARLRSSLTQGATTVLQARPPHTTLRRLAKRLDETAFELNRLAAAAPPTLRNSIREAIGEGASLTNDVRLALGIRPLILPPAPAPPVAIAPPADSQPEQPASSPPPPRRTTREPVGKPGGKDNSFGPGGAPKVDEPAPGETWSSDDPLQDECPLGMVAAPGVSDLCGAARGESP